MFFFTLNFKLFFEMHARTRARRASLSAGRSWALVLAVTAAIMHNADSAPVGVRSFPELLLAVDSGARNIAIAAPETVFDHQVEVRFTEKALLIESTIGATLFGRYQTRLFFLQNGSALSLRGVNLVGGVASGNCSECAQGGAIFVSAGSELRLRSVRVVDNRAIWGGAIYTMSSIVIATDCTLSQNSAAFWGGAVGAAGDSTFTATNCTLTSNLAFLGGAVYAVDASTFTATDCTMTQSSASWGGAVGAAGDSTFTATNCTLTSNSAFLGGAVYAVDASTFTATDCTMTQNSAYRGGAVAVANGSLAHIWDSCFESNHAEVPSPHGQC